MSPSPKLRHQTVVLNFLVLLRPALALAAGSELFRAMAPFPVDVVPGPLVED